jgi:hypothetical protein
MGGKSGAVSLSSGTVTAESVKAESDRSESELWLQSERADGSSGHVAPSPSQLSADARRTPCHVSDAGPVPGARRKTAQTRRRCVESDVREGGRERGEPEGGGGGEGVEGLGRAGGIQAEGLRVERGAGRTVTT